MVVDVYRMFKVTRLKMSYANIKQFKIYYLAAKTEQLTRGVTEYQGFLF